MGIAPTAPDMPQKLLHENHNLKTLGSGETCPFAYRGVSDLLRHILEIACDPIECVNIMDALARPLAFSGKIANR
jgi:hypothetical protein